MRALLYATLLALVGAIVRFAAMSLAASSWTSMDDRVLFLAGVLPVFGVLGGAALDAKTSGKPDAWPPSMPMRLLLTLVGTVVGGLSAYMCFTVVAVKWGGKRYSR